MFRWKGRGRLRRNLESKVRKRGMGGGQIKNNIIGQKWEAMIGRESERRRIKREAMIIYIHTYIYIYIYTHIYIGYK
jgi:hypothetical protein